MPAFRNDSLSANCGIPDSSGKRTSSPVARRRMVSEKSAAESSEETPAGTSDQVCVRNKTGDLVSHCQMLSSCRDECVLQFFRQDLMASSIAGYCGWRRPRIPRTATRNARRSARASLEIFRRLCSESRKAINRNWTTNASAATAIASPWSFQVGSGLEFDGRFASACLGFSLH